MERKEIDAKNKHDSVFKERCYLRKYVMLEPRCYKFQRRDMLFEWTDIGHNVCLAPVCNIRQVKHALHSILISQCLLGVKVQR